MPNRVRTRRRRRWPWALAALSALIAVGGVAFYAASLARSFDSSKQTLESAFPDESTRPSAVPGEPGMPAPQNILLLGSDTRGAVGDDLGAIRGQRADTIMVVTIPASRDAVYVTSIMRDSWVPIAGFGEAKVNAALSYGRVPLMVQTVESLLGARIDRVAIVDFEGFAGLTDALGGVQVDNEKAFSSLGQDFAAGPIRLDGDAALAYVRARYPFADGDYQRVRNQQSYLKGLIGGLLDSDTLLNPARLSESVSAITPYLTVDAGVDSAYLAGLALQLPSLRSGDLRFFSVPTSGTGTSADGQSIVLVDWAKLETLRGAFAADNLGTYAP